MSNSFSSRELSREDRIETPEVFSGYQELVDQIDHFILAADLNDDSRRIGVLNAINKYEPKNEAEANYFLRFFDPHKLGFLHGFEKQWENHPLTSDNLEGIEEPERPDDFLYLSVMNKLEHEEGFRQLLTPETINVFFPES